MSTKAWAEMVHSHLSIASRGGWLLSSFGRLWPTTPICCHAWRHLPWNTGVGMPFHIQAVCVMSCIAEAVLPQW